MAKKYLTRTEDLRMKTTENRSFFEKHLIILKDDSKNQRIKKMAVWVAIGVVLVALIVTGAVYATSFVSTEPDPIDVVSVEPSELPSEPISSEPEEVVSVVEVDPLATLEWKEEPIKKTVLVLSAATVREKPSQIAKEIKTLKKGDEIKAVALTTTGYYKLEDGSFINGGLVEEKQAAGGGPTTPAKPETPAAPKPPTQSALDQAKAAGILEKFAEPYAANKQLKGQITVPGTGKVYYVAQSGNNTSYLNRDFYGGGSGWGNPYLDYRVSVTPGGTSNIVVYAHSNDQAGTQFSGFKGYKDVNFYKNNPTIRFDTIYGEGTYKVVAFFKEDTRPGTGYYRYHDIALAGTSASFIETVKGKSYWTPVVDVVDTDQLLVVSTCWDTNGNNYNRLVTVARKVRPDEDPSVDTSGATQVIPITYNKFGK